MKPLLSPALLGEVFDFLMVADNLPRRDSSMLECVQVGDGPVTLAFHPPSRAAAAGPIVRYLTGGPLIL